MLIAALVFCWMYRNQTSHATPLAFFIACPLSAIVAAVVGWMAAPGYVRGGWLVSLLAPMVAVAASVTAAAVMYAALLLPLLHRPFWSDGSATPGESLVYEISRVPEYISFYGVVSSLVWLPGMLLVSLYLWFRRRALRRG